MRLLKTRRIATLITLTLVAGLATGVRAEEEPDRAKKILELGAESVLEKARDDAGAAPADNPKVLPGRVKWHRDQATAGRAAQVSGKPVLVFQLLGQLDEEFC